MHRVKIESSAQCAQPERTGRSHCAQAALALCRVVACRVPYRRPSTGRVAGPPWPYHGYVAALTLALLRAVSLKYRRACHNTPEQPSLHLSRYNRLYRDTLPNGQASLSYHDTMLRIATLTPNQAVLWPPLGMSWPISAVSWPSPLRLLRAVLPCVTIQKLYRDSNWEKGQ